MLGLSPQSTDEPLRVLCLGAHADDVEIGVAATLLRLQQERPVIARAVIFSATDERRGEQEHASKLLFADAAVGVELLRCHKAIHCQVLWSR